MKNIRLFSILATENIFSALQKIDNNKKGFLVVVDENFVVKGTVTDGDIRRGLLKGVSLESSITQVYQSQFVSLKNTATFDELINIFKSEKYDFLPIVDFEDKLYNIITKKQFHLLLIEDIPFDWNFDFFSLDESRLDHEIYNRPWGYYKTTFLNPFSRAKIIKVYPNGELSLQEHKKREEYWVIIKGKGRVVIGESIKEVSAGDHIFIPKGCKHRITNLSTEESLMISEVQLGEYFGEDDIIRYEDKYGRM